MNDISFKAYDEWSEEWNNAGVYFRGDFNGNGYTLSDIDSKYGLFRAITGDAQAYDFTLTKAFSQTAMLAAYMTSSDGGNATLHDIIIDSTKNDKRLANANIETLDINSIKLSDDENSFNINHISCGVYVGYLERGTLQNLDLVGDTFTITSLIDEQHYVGSYVGEYYGGNIIHDNFISNQRAARREAVSFCKNDIINCTVIHTSYKPHHNFVGNFRRTHNMRGINVVFNQS